MLWWLLLPQLRFVRSISVLASRGCIPGSRTAPWLSHYLATSASRYALTLGRSQRGARCQSGFSLLILSRGKRNGNSYLLGPPTVICFRRWTNRRPGFPEVLILGLAYARSGSST
ncbi:hypothetical protein BJY52DRAFT_1278805 [Lactarius psammicola]|nr:hypothetical protein BJY52DRAFT_1278805 [Lactarius psammicola]